MGRFAKRGRNGRALDAVKETRERSAGGGGENSEEGRLGGGGGVDVCLDENALRNAPSCPHGPTLLFERHHAHVSTSSTETSSALPRRFYACSASRDRKQCNFFHWEDEVVMRASLSQPLYKEGQREPHGTIQYSRQEYQSRLKSVRKLVPSERQFCRTCSQLLTNEDSPRDHVTHAVQSGLSDSQLNNPTTLLEPVDNNKTNAQYLFADATVEFLVQLITETLNIRRVLCIGTPRLYEALLRRNARMKENRNQVECILLDIDQRLSQFYSPEQLCRYNMFNHHFFDDNEEKDRGARSSRQIYQEFISSASSSSALSSSGAVGSESKFKEDTTTNSSRGSPTDGVTNICQPQRCNSVAEDNVGVTPELPMVGSNCDNVINSIKTCGDGVMPNVRRDRNDIEMEGYGLVGSRNSDNILVVIDPPFGGLVEVIAHTLQRITRDWRRRENRGASENDETTIIPTLWIFPYFMESRIITCLPSFSMLDYRVNYANHLNFCVRSDIPGRGSKNGSPVRIFTNLPLSDIILPAEEGYRFCSLCQRYVAGDNLHCPLCDRCTTKIGRTYVHCSLCGRCVKPSWRHCAECKTCEIPGQHTIVLRNIAQSAGCHICGEYGHKRKDCPKRNPHKKCLVTSAALDGTVNQGKSAANGMVMSSETRSSKSNKRKRQRPRVSKDKRQCKERTDYSQKLC